MHDGRAGRTVLMAAACIFAGLRADAAPSLARQSLPADMPAEVRRQAERLYDEDEKHVVAAIGTLGEMGPAAVSAAPLLATMLDGHFSLAVPNSAGMALVKMGKGAFEATAAAVNPTAGDARRRAVLALVRIDPERAIPVVFELFAADIAGPHDLAALAMIGEPARAYVLRACQSSDAATRSAAARALPAFAHLRISYRALIGHSADLRDRPAWARTQVVIDSLVRAAADSDTSVRLSALRSLRRIADCPDKVLPLGDELRAALRDGDPEVRREAIAVVLTTDEPAKTRLDAIVPLLSDASAEVRGKAASAIGRLPSMRERAAPLLMNLLQDEDPAIREQAAIGLGRLGAAESEGRLLAAMGKQQPRPVRAAAVGALGESGGKAAVEELIRLLQEDPDAMLRLEAVKALGAIYARYYDKPRAGKSKTMHAALKPEEAELAEKIFQALARALTDPLADLHEPALQALGRTPPDAQKDLVPLLVLGLKSRGSSHNAQHLVLQLQLRDDRLLNTLHELLLKGAPTGHIDEILVKYGDPRSVAVLEKIVARGGVQGSFASSALTRMGEPGMAALRRGLGHADPQVREATAKSLAYFLSRGHHAEIVALVAAAQASDDAPLRQSAQRVLSLAPKTAKDLAPAEQRLRALLLDGGDAPSYRIKDNGQLAVAAVALLSDNNVVVRAGAAALLGAMGRKSDAAAVRRLLRDPSAQVRAQAAETLGQLGDAESAAALISTLRDQEAPVREAAAVALGRLQPPSAAAPLRTALRDPDAAVRRASAAALGGLPARAAGDELARYLAEDPDWRVRQAAAESLGRIGDDSRRAALTAALQDAHWSVRRAAERAIAPRALETHQKPDALKKD